jgi:hypothetical protein
MAALAGLRQSTRAVVTLGFAQPLRVGLKADPLD